MEFVLVSVLVVMVLLGVLQLTLALHVRNTVVDAAGEGARYGALEGSSPAEGAQRTRELIGSALHPRYGEDVSAQVVERGGMALVEVTVRAPVPVLGLLGPAGTMTATGRAVQE
ncbi:TadE/TadG family type IV pilus assembly protein [Georgenia phoenicis]|uniref:TadE/TadG family type IV pilus assembly protein n=1 Tax=unclassified Georgenia TaxID=2626815 RepID=UPI0039B0A11F